MADSSVRKRTHDAAMSGKNPYVKLTDEQLNNELEKLTGMSVDGAAVSLPDDLSEAGGREPPAKMAKANLDADLALDDIILHCMCTLLPLMNQITLTSKK